MKTRTSNNNEGKKTGNIEKAIAAAIRAYAGIEDTIVGTFFIGWLVGMISISVLGLIIAGYIYGSFIGLSPKSYIGTNTSQNGGIHSANLIDIFIPIPIMAAALIASYVIFTTNIKSTWLYGFYLRLKLFKTIFRGAITHERLSGGDAAIYLVAALIVGNASLLTLAVASHLRVMRVMYPFFDTSLFVLYLVSSLIIPISYVTYGVILHMRKRSRMTRFIALGMVFLLISAYINVEIILKNFADVETPNLVTTAEAITITILTNLANIAYYYLAMSANYKHVLTGSKNSLINSLEGICVKREKIENGTNKKCKTIRLTLTKKNDQNCEKDLLTYMKESIKRHLKVSEELEKESPDMYQKLALFLFVAQASTITLNKRFQRVIKNEKEKEKCVKLAFILTLADIIQHHVDLRDICGGKGAEKREAESCLWTCFGLSPYSQSREKGFIELPAYLRYDTDCEQEQPKQAEKKSYSVTEQP